MSDFDQEKINERLYKSAEVLRERSMPTYLRRANHVLLGRHKLADSVVELAPLPSVDALLLRGIPVKSLVCMSACSRVRKVAGGYVPGAHRWSDCTCCTSTCGRGRGKRRRG